MTRKTRKPSRPETIRALAYRRVSTGQQAVNGASLPAQESATTAEISKRGWTLAGVVTDAGQSGTVAPDNRPGLGPALAMLDAGEADALVGSKIDRVSRSVLDFAALVERADAHGWQLVTLDLPLDANTPVGKAMRQMLSVFAELERNFIAQRTREGMAIRKEAGWPNGHPGGRPSAADDVVARIKAEREAGRTWRAIADGLTADGVATSQGGQWWPMTVRTIYQASQE